MIEKLLSVQVEATPIGHRRRIWQIDAGMHCSVLGTCLTLNDLHLLARRARYRIDPGTTAYKLHSCFVDMMVYPNDLSKQVDKELERRYRKAAETIRGARTEQEIEARWKEVAAQGHVAGAYWGAMSHPLCSHDLEWKLFGEIHMLSHLVGASRRADLARVHELEGTCATLDARLAHLKHDHRTSLKERKLLEDEVITRRRESDLSERRLATAQRRIEELESQTLTRTLEARVAELERQLRDADERRRTTETALYESRSLIEDLREDAARTAEQMRELAAENEALEAELTASVVCPFAGGAVSVDDDRALFGKRVLCVGGRVGLVPHYRAVVERRGGEFVHHDGGLEDSMDAVTRALSTVDAVVCPVDYVSHAACLKVKRACKNLGVRFLPLRSSGLSSFARGIRSIVDEVPAAAE